MKKSAEEIPLSAKPTMQESEPSYFPVFMATAGVGFAK
jgi:hypothetical protein